VSALDVSVQARVLNLFARLGREDGLTLLFIAHDFSVVKHIAHHVAVMYLGKIAEAGPALDVFAHPLHPYTQTLIQAAPIADPRRARSRQRLSLEGEPPSPLCPPAGCPFHPRCPMAGSECRPQPPPLETKNAHHQAACFRLD